MAEEKKNEAGEKKEPNSSKKSIIIAVLAVLLVGAVFLLGQQYSNKNSVDKSIQDIANSAASSDGTTQETEAGAIGKNEIKLTSANFKTEVEDYKGVVLVDFYLSTCPHCKNVAKEVTDASDQLVGKVKVGKLEAKDNSDLSDRFKIESVPTFVVFKDGKEVNRATGERKKDEIIKLVEKYTK